MTSAGKALLGVCLFAAASSAAGSVAAGEEEPFTPAEYAAAISNTVSGCAVHAVLGPAEIPLPLAVSDFLLDHPDMSAYIVNRRRIAPYRIVMLGVRRSYADDGEGTKGVVDLIQETDRHRVYYGEGVHSSFLFPDIRATAVVVMDLSETAGPDSRARTIMTFRVWVRVKNGFVSGLVKTLLPFLQGTVVRKFSKALSVADALGRLIAGDPAAIAEDIRDYSGLFAEDRVAILAMLARLPSGAASSR